METIHITASSVDAAQLEVLKAVMKALKIKFSLKKEKESTYNQEFVAKIQKSRKQAAEGKTVKIALDDIWK
ncbi:MAG: hypothetical protein MUE53_04865 [Chitinophagales bacterium]|nr:hypothetical protein [Chitinophagales bacterium]